MKKNYIKHSKFILIFILLVASLLRLWKISSVPVSLFGDELDLSYHAYSIGETGRDYQGNFMPLHFHSLAEWRTPLYLYAAVPTVHLFGITPLGARLPAAIFGILGVYGMYLLVKEMVNYVLPSKKENNKKAENLALLSSFILSINPWHLQYSRAGFEVTQLIAFLIFGLYFFIFSLRNKGKYLWLSVIFLTFTPWIYSTAKLFTPLLMLFLFITWRKEILGFGAKVIKKSVVTGLIIGLPIAYSTIFGGGAQRATYTSVFTNPTIETEVGFNRTMDSIKRGEIALGAKPNFWDRLYHNKLVFWYENISNNYLTSYSFDFLFSKGDPNLRHSPSGIGQFYKIEIITLVLGLFIFFRSKIERKIKLLLGFLFLFGALPAELTRDGGNHATRLILILPAFILVMSYGLNYLLRSSRFLTVVFLTILSFNFVFYLHNYYVHYPWDSERWWHSGYKESIQSIKSIDKDYEKVIISMQGEPAWIFFAGWYEYTPKLWQENFPVGNDVELNGFGKVSHIDKFYFGNFNVEGESIYDLPKYLDSKTLYLAVAKEIGANLIREPERTPPGLKLLKAVPYPSGEPAFYLFTGS